MKKFQIADNLEELTAHRTTVLPIACYDTTIREHVQGFIPLHWHEELQFVVVRNGTARFLVNEHMIDVQAGEGLFINRGVLHMAKDEQGGSRYHCINVAPHFVVDQALYMAYVYPYIQTISRPFVHLREQEEVDNIIEMHRLLEQKPPFYELELVIKLQQLWRMLIEHHFSLATDVREVVKQERMKAMLAWIHAHYAEQVTLAEIAQAGSLSRSECCRYFQRILKKSPVQYVTQYRLQQSLVLLQDAHYSITEIAFEVGFQSTSYFIEKFKEPFLQTPLQYRKSMNEFVKNRL